MEILDVFPLQTFDDDGFLLGSCLYGESLIGMIAVAIDNGDNIRLSSVLNAINDNNQIDRLWNR